MSRRMIDPSVVIKSQIVNDKEMVDLYELLEKYGTEGIFAKNVTLQIYSQECADDDSMSISDDTGRKGAIVINTAIIISKVDNTVFIRGLLVDNLDNMNFLSSIMINDGDYEDGIILHNPYPFDVHVIKV